MGLEFFRRAVELAKQSRAAAGMTVRHTIQTNGTKIDGDWARFFRANGFLVGPQHRRTARAARRLSARQGRQAHLRQGHARSRGAARARGGVERPDHRERRQRRRTPVEVYRFLRDDCGCEFIQFIPIVERPVRGRRAATAASHRALGRRRMGWGAFLIDVFDEWVRRDVGEVFVQFFDVALANWYGEPSGLCVHIAHLRHRAGHGVQRRRVRLRPLRRAATTCAATSASSTSSELVGSDRQVRFGRRQARQPAALLRHCDVRFACHGGCPKDRFVTAPRR